MHNHKTRLAKLEKVTGEHGIKFVPQIVIYDRVTLEPLVTPDLMAQQIWIGVSDERERELILRR